ncbi:MAG: PQQ-binding-like beta-propeller repeat protein [Vicinamibacterales bacterium]
MFPVQDAWNQPLDRLVTAPPAFAGNRAFFPVEDGRLAAVDVASGTPAWRADAVAATTPAAGEGLVFAAGRDQLTALRQDTGQVVWHLPFSAALAVPLVWDNGWLVAVDTAGTIFAFRASDGELIWRQDLGVAVHAAPALAADRVYVPLEDGRVQALDVATGARQWERSLGGAPNEMLALEDRIYVGSDDNFLYCLTAGDGAVAWRWRTGGDVIGVPVVDDSRVYFVSRDNVLRALDRKSGAQRWKRALATRPTRGPVRAGGILLVSGLTPKIFAFNLKDGTPAGDLTAPGELAAAPYVLEIVDIPQVVVVARDLAHGTRVLAFKRNLEPPMNAPMREWPAVLKDPDLATTLAGGQPQAGAGSAGTPPAAPSSPAGGDAQPGDRVGAPRR